LYNTDKQRKKWERGAAIVNILQNQSGNKYEYVVLILKKKSKKENFDVKKSKEVKTNSVNMSK
jgi:hypothetical protein